MKKCFKCNKEKSLFEFYKHSGMKDGYLGKCKECAKIDTKKNRINNIEHYRKYDRKRGNRQGYEYTKNYRHKYPNKYKAHSITRNAIQAKKLFKEPCEVCGTTKNICAHHDDYLKPLNVRWLCSAHHAQWHVKNGEGMNPF